jgi:thiamine biosynthesis lipoprotein
MGTLFRIVVHAPDEKRARKAAQAAFDRIDQLDRIMSDYKEDSELMRLCARAGGAPVVVGPDLFSVLRTSQELARRSEGAFDVTVGPVVRLWRRARRQRVFPGAAKLKEALGLVGHELMVLNEKNGTILLQKKGMLLDLGGIAKGYAADEALKVLVQEGMPRSLVAAGGDVAVGEPPPGNTGWRVGIAPMESPEQKPTRFLILKNAAVSTSGDAEQHVEIDGKRYSHILDPRTGLALVGRSGVTVIGPNGTTSDSLATAASVLGPAKGLKLVEATDGCAALFLVDGPDGKQEYASRNWPKEL